MSEVWGSRSYDSTTMMEDAHSTHGDLVARLPTRWRRLATGVCEDLAQGGHRGWIVGGAVRDLLLGRAIKDVDLVSAALPDEVEALFERTVAVGKSFGIIVVIRDGEEVELATFRRERGYSDRRRPDEVEYASTPEADAGRRDFTCNAIYLDPLTGALRDPVGGLADLRAGQLRAVGDPVARFREDGLRILRMARFLAALGLEPAPGLASAAEAERASLRGVSAERVRDELQKILCGPRAARALEVLVTGGHASLCLPSMGTDEEARLRLQVLAALGVEAPGGAVADTEGAPTAGPGWALGLAALFGPVLVEVLEGTGAAGVEGSAQGLGVSLAEGLAALRCSREERRVASEICGVAVALGAGVRDGITGAGPTPEEERGRWIQLWRTPERAPAARLVGAWALASAAPNMQARVEGTLAQLAALEAAAPADSVALAAGDLMELGVERGPGLGALLRRVEHAGLGAAFGDRAGALAWARSAIR